LLLPQGINGARPHFVRKRTFSYRKWGQAPFIPWASLSSPSERNRTRSAFLTVFHHTAIAKQGMRKRGQATFSPRKRKSLLMDRTTEKVACPLFLVPFFSEYV